MKPHRRCDRLSSPRAALVIDLRRAARAGPRPTTAQAAGTSLNGTSAFAEMLRSRGNEIRTAIRLTDSLAEWAHGIVRFSPYPGPPEADEAEWYRTWLADDPDRWLIYVVRDFDATAEYWKQVRDATLGNGRAGTPGRG